MKYYWFIYLSLIPLLAISLNSQAQTLEEFEALTERLPTIGSGDCLQASELGILGSTNIKLDVTGDYLTIHKSFGLSAFQQWSGNPKTINVTNSFLTFKLTNKTDLECSTCFSNTETIVGIYNGYNSPTFRATYTQNQFRGSTKICTYKTILKGGTRIAKEEEEEEEEELDIVREVKWLMRPIYVELFKDDLESNSTRKSRTIALAVRG